MDRFKNYKKVVSCKRVISLILGLFTISSIFMTTVYAGADDDYAIEQAKHVLKLVNGRLKFRQNTQQSISNLIHFHCRLTKWRTELIRISSDSSIPSSTANVVDFLIVKLSDASERLAERIKGSQHFGGAIQQLRDVCDEYPNFSRTFTFAELRDVVHTPDDGVSEARRLVNVLRLCGNCNNDEDACMLLYLRGRLFVLRAKLMGMCSYCSPLQRSQCKRAIFSLEDTYREVVERFRDSPRLGWIFGTCQSLGLWTCCS